MVAIPAWLIVGALAGTAVGIIVHGRRYGHIFDLALGAAGAVTAASLLSLLAAGLAALGGLSLLDSCAIALAGGTLLTAFVHALPASLSI